MRAFCLEYGIAMHQGAGRFKADLPLVLADEANDLTPAMRRLLMRLSEDVRALEARIAEVTGEIEDIAAADDTTRRLMTIPSIGPLAATGLLAAAGKATQFRKARHMAAWLGLTPREHFTGGKTTLLGISKRGSSYLRRLFMHGARSCLLHLDRSRDRLGGWLDGLQKRMHNNKAVVALAAKMARVAGVVITKPGATYDRRTVSSEQKSGPHSPSQLFENGRARISSWPGRNSGPLARGRIHLCRLGPSERN